jgi:TatD DNase family protein
MLVDSHCHLDRLDLSRYDGHLDAALAEAHQQGVGHMLCVSIDLDAYPAMLALVQGYEDVSVSVGVHPSHRPTPDLTVEALLERAEHPKVVALGETGLDYHYNEGDLEWQRDQFRTHIRAARACRKPLIIHSRDAKQDTLAILREEQAAEAGGVMHCFTEDWAMAEQAMELNFYISFSGIVTFKNAEVLKDVARRVPLERMLIETDSPYLAPVPRRGKPNEPALVHYVAEYIAELRGTTVEAIAEATTANFFRLFPLAR